MSERTQIRFFVDAEFFEMFKKILAKKNEKMKDRMFIMMKKYIEDNHKLISEKLEDDLK